MRTVLWATGLDLEYDFDLVDPQGGGEALVAYFEHVSAKAG